MNERTIFMNALEIPEAAKREAYLDEACASDPALRQNVAALLKSHAEASGFLEKPVIESAGGDTRTFAGDTPSETPTDLTVTAKRATSDATLMTPAEPPQRGDPDLAFLSRPTKPGSLGRLGHYEVQAVIGKGGFGIVLRSFDERLHRVVAIKALSLAYAANGSARKRFIREARAAAAVKNEHVVGIYDVQEDAQPPYLVMECIDGVSLQDKIDKQGPLGIKEILRIGDPAFLEHAKKMVDRVHAADPEVVFQGCLFEQVSTDINKLKIPAWVFEDFGLPVEDRTFSCAAIIKREGWPDRRGGRGGTPIINNLETRLWFYFQAASYMKIGVEALHLGQVGLIGAEDRDLKVYSEFLAKVRTYAKLHARRHLVLMDGHVPSGGMVKDGVSLLDFNSFPMRIKAVPGKPHEGILEVGHLDAIFKRSKACVSPSGWKCDGLPYLVELDNFGRGPNPNVADPKSMFCWGWDEISWFAQQPEEYRNQWLLYAHDWIKKTDPNGHLEMPGIRMISCPNETLRTYFANTKSPNCPVGYSQEETIRKIWRKKRKARGSARWPRLKNIAPRACRLLGPGPPHRPRVRGHSLFGHSVLGCQFAAVESRRSEKDRAIGHAQSLTLNWP